MAATATRSDATGDAGGCEPADPAAVEYATCKINPGYLADKHLYIDDTQGHGDGSGVMSFTLWPCQVWLFCQLLAHRCVIILKARQLGISWICCAYALWLCLFKNGQTVLIFSIGQTESDEQLRRVKVLYDRLAPWLRALLPRRTKSNNSEQVWANGSSIKSLPGVAGKSFTASLVILDEFANNEGASELYAAVKPTIDGGGQLIILSTANGIGNAFHRLWVMAKAGNSPFKTIFLPWWSRPGRDEKWYAEVLAGCEDPATMLENYPANDTESFLSSGRMRFPSVWIARQQENVRSPIPVADLPEDLRKLHASCTTGSNVNLSVYALPDPKRKYILAADVAEGLATGDYSTATLIDTVSWEEIAHIHGHWEPAVYAGYIQILGEFYSGLVAIERNNHGHAVIATLVANSCKNLYEAEDRRYGWLTNLKSKPLSIDTLAEALRDNLCKIRTAATLNEMQIYTVNDKGGTEAPKGYHDDRVMTWAIGLAIANAPKEGWALDEQLQQWLLERAGIVQQGETIQ